MKTGAFDESEDATPSLDVMFTEPKEAEEKPPQLEVVEKVKPVAQPGNFEMVGCTLLSRPAFSNCLDPLYVGAVYKNLNSGKYFYKVRKLIYNIQYLINFIQIDKDNGFYINILSGKLLTK